MRQRSRSVWVPSIHPFNADSSLDEGGFRVHLQRLANAGLNVLVANEGSGESFTFSDAEMVRVMEIAKEELQGKVIVRGMGRMVRKASDMIEFVRLVEEIGLDGVHIYTLEMGHGLTPSVAEQERCSAMCSSTPTSPPYSRCIDTPVQLSGRSTRPIVDDYPQIVGAIMTTNDVLYLWEVLEALGKRMEVHTHTLNAMTNLSLGGDGFAAPEANLAPRLCASVMQHYTAGRYRGSSCLPAGRAALVDLRQVRICERHKGRARHPRSAGGSRAVAAARCHQRGTGHDRPCSRRAGRPRVRSTRMTADPSSLPTADPAHLFQSIRIGGRTSRNRIVLPPNGANQSEAGLYNEGIVRYYGDVRGPNCGAHRHRRLRRAPQFGDAQTPTHLRSRKSSMARGSCRRSAQERHASRLPVDAPRQSSPSTAGTTVLDAIVGRDRMDP